MKKSFKDLIRSFKNAPSSNKKWVLICIGMIIALIVWFILNFALA